MGSKLSSKLILMQLLTKKIPYGYKAVPNPNGKRPKYILEEVPEEVENIKKTLRFSKLW